jgi:hypothetical protein
MENNLNSNQAFQLKEGLRLRIKQLEENIAACKNLDQPEYVKYWQQSLDEAKLVENMFLICYNISVK